MPSMPLVKPRQHNIANHWHKELYYDSDSVPSSYKVYTLRLHLATASHRCQYTLHLQLYATLSYRLHIRSSRPTTIYFSVHSSSRPLLSYTLRGATVSLSLSLSLSLYLFIYIYTYRLHLALAICSVHKRTIILRLFSNLSTGRFQHEFR